MALRFAIQLGTLEMLGSQVDPTVRRAFSLFQPVRDRIAVTGGHGAERQYASLYHAKPGPMLMAAAISMVAALSDDPECPIQAAKSIAEHYTAKAAEPAFRLLQRALVSNDVFGEAAVARIKLLQGRALGPTMSWRNRLRLDPDDGLSAEFGEFEQLVGLGEWALARTSPATAKQRTARTDGQDR